MDDRLNDNYNKLLEVMQFGIDLVVVSLQGLIASDWYGIKVEERLSEFVQPDNSDLQIDAKDP